MEDLEICKRIAEIEGIEPFWIGDKELLIPNNTGVKRYNPLTDKALCFDLMVKHEINVRLAIAKSKGRYAAEWKYAMDIYCGIKYSDNPQRAICLAIIGKHEGQQ